MGPSVFSASSCWLAWCHTAAHVATFEAAADDLQSTVVSITHRHESDRGRFKRILLRTQNYSH